MPASFRNLINIEALKNAMDSGDYSGVFKKKKTDRPKYIKGYNQESAIESLARTVGAPDIVNQALGIEDKKLDAYDPYHTSDAKKEEFWGGDKDGKAIQNEYDEDTNTFKRGLYSQDEFGGYGNEDFWYEDPTYPSFELFFDEDSPLFVGDNTTRENPKPNSLKSFIFNYSDIDLEGYLTRFDIWGEFKKVFFKIFEKQTSLNSHRNAKNKAYYITKVEGLDNLNKKIINFGEDKITITLNEDVSYLAYYISELYNNLVYSYSHKRYAFPENVIRFNLSIKINDMRNFQLPTKTITQSSQTAKQSQNLIERIRNTISNYTAEDPASVYEYKYSNPSYILYTLHDCTFDFFESRNYGNEIEIGGFNASRPASPSVLSFNIYYKSVTRSSVFPLIKDSLMIQPWENFSGGLFTKKITEKDSRIDTLSKYFETLDRIKDTATDEPKGFLNGLLTNAAQTVVNAAANYADNLETKLREKKGSAVNFLLDQFRSASNINKIEPDNVYKGDFNNRISLTNAARGAASSLLNDLERGIRGGGS